MPKTTTKTNTLKKRMLDALEKSLGVVTTACKAVGVRRDQHYQWLKTDEAYAEAVENIKGVAIDFAESHLHKQIKDGSTAATIFLLKTIGKKRGYVERTEQQVTVTEFPDWLK